MFNLLVGLTKAAVGVAVAPVAVVADIVTLPACAMDNKSPFDRTAKVMDGIGDNVTKALKP